MNKQNILLIIGTIALTWFCFWYFSNDVDIMRQVKDLETQRDTLISANKTLSFKNDSLVLLKQKEVVKYVKIKQQIKDKQDETNNAIDNVYSLDEQQLDSILRNYKHTERN
jgi:regulator of replication initiation timing